MKQGLLIGTVERTGLEISTGRVINKRLYKNRTLVLRNLTGKDMEA